MLIGVPMEIKNHEYRAGGAPAGRHAPAASGHQLRVQSGAGSKIGFSDELYHSAGAEITADAHAVYSAELVVKVKELQPAEFPLLHAGLAQDVGRDYVDPLTAIQ